MAKKKRMTIYKRSLLGWMLILLLISIFCWIYVYLTMIQYEKSNINNYMDTLIKDIIKKPSNYFELDSKFESENAIRNSLKEANIKFKQVDSKSNDKYYLYIDNNNDKSYTTGEEFAIITLDNSKKVKKLGMLNYNIWDIKEVEAVTTTAKIYASEGNNITVNGVKLETKDIKETSKIPEFEEAYEYVELPKINYYEIDNLIVNPIVKNDNNIISLEDGVYRADTYFKTNSIDEAMKKLKNSYNPLEFAETWQMFLRAEYDNEKGRGLARVAPNLIEGTKMYKKAKDWATNVAEDLGNLLPKQQHFAQLAEKADLPYFQEQFHYMYLLYTLIP